MSAPSLSIVMPAYNEERRLPRLLAALAELVPAEVARAGLALAEVVVVDDGSEDGTAALLARAGRSSPVLRPVCRDEPNVGKGRAVAVGAAEARGELVLISDVDLATPLSELGPLWERLQDGADVAIASRDVPGARVEGTPAHRVWMGRTFNAGMRLATGLPFRDTQCGFKLMRAEVARELLRVQLVHGFAYDVEMLLRARAAGLRVDEVPVRYAHDPDSRVRPLLASAQMARDVARLTWHLRVRRARAARLMLAAADGAPAARRATR
jgi:dolichyl-phosphate beta-glucosyltransferase